MSPGEAVSWLVIAGLLLWGIRQAAHTEIDARAERRRRREQRERLDRWFRSTRPEDPS